MHYQGRFLLHIHILIVVMFCLLHGKIYILRYFYRRFFVINSGSVLRLSVSGSAQVFLQSRIYLSLRISLEIVKIYKLYGSVLVFV